MALFETKKELAECDSTEKYSASFFVMIKIGFALNITKYQYPICADEPVEGYGVCSRHELF